MFEPGSAEHLELCLLEMHREGVYGFGRQPVAKVQQEMTTPATSIGYWAESMKLAYPEVYGFLVGYFGGEDFELPMYQPMGSGRTSADMPRDAMGRFLNIPINLTFSYGTDKVGE